MFPPTGHQDPDASIRQTDTDAAVARLSAVQKGYFQDPYIKHLVPRAHLQPPRPPLINIGTFVRSTAIDDLVDQWLVLAKQAGTTCQIVSLGAGSDTRYWRIATGQHKDALAKYVEMDFPEVTSKKAMAIRKSKDLGAVLGDPSQVRLSHGGTALHAPSYHLLPADLRKPPSEALGDLLAVHTDSSQSSSDGHDSSLSPTLPTLLLFECVLVYMSPSASSALLRWFTDYFSPPHAMPEKRTILGSVVYEMFGLDDSFGRVMVNNLKARNISLPGAEPYPTAESLPSRFLSMNFTAARGLSLRDIRQSYIDADELKRVSKVEMLDEVEELNLVLDHYAITWGLFLSDPSEAGGWGQWGLKMRSTLQEGDWKQNL